MLTPPVGLPSERLRQGLAECFAVESAPLTFLPIGEDSWSYRIGDLWVSVRRDLRGYSRAAYDLSRRLMEDGAEYVLAPALWPDGQVARRIGGYPVLVFPYVEAEQMSRQTVTLSELAEVTAMFRHLHGLCLEVDLPREDYTLPFEHEVTEVLSAPGRRATENGPYTGRLLRLIGSWHDVLAEERRELAEVSALCHSDPSPLVLTHGEPCAPNILRTAAGLRLVDWGEASWGPPERDLFHVHRTLGPIGAGRLWFLRFYEIRWRLSEIAEYGTRFLGEHAGDEDDLAMWHRLQRYLPPL